MRLATGLISALVLTTSVAAQEWTDGIPDRIKQSLYPSVVDARWGSEGRSLWLFVIDNGRNQDGLATAACGSLGFYDEIPKGTFIVVRIWDASKASAGTGNAQLGKAECRNL